LAVDLPEVDRRARPNDRLEDEAERVALRRLGLDAGLADRQDADAREAKARAADFRRARRTERLGIRAANRERVQRLELDAELGRHRVTVVRVVVPAERAAQLEPLLDRR